MSPAELVKKTDKEAERCWRGFNKCPVGYTPNGRFTKVAPEQRHTNAHLAAAIKADRRAVAMAAWISSRLHDTNDACPKNAPCLDAVIERLAKEGAS